MRQLEQFRLVLVDYGPTVAAVFNLVCEKADAVTGMLTMSQVALSEWSSRFSERTIRSCLGVLSEAGIIVRHRRNDAYGYRTADRIEIIGLDLRKRVEAVMAVKLAQARRAVARLRGQRWIPTGKIRGRPVNQKINSYEKEGLQPLVVSPGVVAVAPVRLKV